MRGIRGEVGDIMQACARIARDPLISNHPHIPLSYTSTGAGLDVSVW
jgi:hypothetical protein